MGLPVEQRLRRAPDITAAVRRGRRARAGGLVVHALHRAPAPGAVVSDRGAYPGPDPVAAPVASGPRVAFVAPRTCGPAVRRNRTRRRVQELLRASVAAGRADADVDLVVRLLPEATTATTPELAGWLTQALRRLGVDA